MKIINTLLILFLLPVAALLLPIAVVVDGYLHERQAKKYRHK